MKQFEFTREFTRDGQVVSEADGRYVLSSECERRVEQAHRDALDGVEQQIACALGQIASELNPVVPALAGIAVDLRREAAELALAAAEVIAGAALEQNMIEHVMESVEQVAGDLKTDPELIVVVPEQMVGQIEYRMEQMVRSGRNFAFRVEAQSGGVPGDWRIVWDGGCKEFDHDRAVRMVREAVASHVSGPVDVQGDLFGEFS